MRGSHREPRTNVGKLIRTARLGRGLSMRELSEAFDCSFQFVSNIEGGVTPVPPAYYHRVIRILAIQEGELLEALTKDLEDKFYATMNAR